MLAVQRHWDQIEIHSHRAAARLAAEYDPSGAGAEAGEVDAEHRWIGGIVGVQRQSTKQARDRGTHAQHRPPGLDSNLNAHPDHGTGANVEERAGQAVVAADIRPDLRMVRHIGADRIATHTEQLSMAR